MGHDIMRDIAPQALNLVGVFVVTLCVFPGVVMQWAPGPTSSFYGSRQLFGTMLIGTFQVGDLASRALSGPVARRMAPAKLWIFVLARFALIPVFMAGQLHPTTCVLWGSDLGRF